MIASSYRFELLGDTVLGLVVTELLLCDMHSGLRVGPCTVRMSSIIFLRQILQIILFQKIRALIVGNATLADMYVDHLHLIRYSRVAWTCQSAP
jgi:hypothetical protein